MGTSSRGAALVRVNVSHVVNIVDFTRAYIFQRDLCCEKEVVCTKLNRLRNLNSARPYTRPRGTVELVPTGRIPCWDVLDIEIGEVNAGFLYHQTLPLLIIRFS